MDPTEQHVNEYLRAIGYTSVVFEPDGNNPPDFSVNGVIGVEVRRLNQENNFGNAPPEGLEDKEYSLYDGMLNLAGSFGPPTNGKSWFLRYMFSRPIGRWKQLQPKVKDALDNFLLAPTNERTMLLSLPNFRVYISPASAVGNSKLVVGGYVDLQAGGFVISEMERNIRKFIIEKSCKVDPVRHTHNEWWLVLVNHIAHAVDSSEQSAIRELLRIEKLKAEYFWDRIFVIDNVDFNQWFEL
ncbi:hypothetical protein [Pseudomonas wuhanensis]|uniref:Uncharacterized protein n=1 Tax=Pseudomonas wuhanensis TaxID=2954098 RepID=A0ABY9GUK4_9PSED|nr:hypothetical protein [Pseudomonas sp. FP607]WLI19486.1 hypothetical protein PSH88_05455 [Pseudomonas sp. FP607]